MEMVRVAESDLRQTVEGIFESFELPADDASTVADALVEADMMGVSSHGVSNYIQLIYEPGLRSGKIVPNPEKRVVQETATTALVDGGGGMGQVVGSWAMELAIEKAAAAGVGLVTVRNSRHYGAAGVYSKMALEHDMIGISLTNSDALVLPTHGTTARMGTNPLAVAVPTAEQPPFLLDMATCTVPLGKVMLAARAGESIPLGWAADEAGEPTTDPVAAFKALRLLPLGGSYESGGHKGYGLAVVVDVLCGLLSGAGGAFEEGLGTAVGHFFAAVRLDAFMPSDAFKAAMDAYLTTVRDSPAKEESEPVIYAGIKEARAREEREREGIPLHPEVVEYLRDLCGRQGVETSL